MDMTFAKIAEKLARKENEYTDKLNKATTTSGRNTARRMLERVKARKDALVEENRMMAEPAPDEVQQFGDGGFLERLASIYKRNVTPLQGVTKAGNKLPVPNDVGSAYRTGFWNSVPDFPTSPTAYTSTNQVATPEVSKASTVSGVAPAAFQGSPLRSIPGNEMLYSPPVAAAPPALPSSKTKAPVYTVTKEDMQFAERGMFDHPISAMDFNRHKAVDAKALEADKLKAYGEAKVADADQQIANYKPYAGTFGDKLSGAMPGVMRSAGILGTFLDNFANRRAINRMEGPATPVYTPGVKLDTTYDINPQLSAARDGETVLNRSIDNSMTSAGSATASKIGAFAQRLRNTGELYGQKTNAESQMRNHETMINANINANNIALGNVHRQAKVDFKNAKTQAIAANSANYGQDLMDISSDYQQNIVAPAQRMDIWKDYLNRFGTMDRKMAAVLEMINKGQLKPQ